MIYSGYEILWLFFVYSFLGWIAETAAFGADLSQCGTGAKRDGVNRSFTHGKMQFGT
ncbi:hypothetical protein Lac3_22080 [Claveliimonas bilis]|nr:hypothetical protein Lac3_22080 [Claveliimonas bilis]